jgi:hypothetical protein
MRLRPAKMSGGCLPGRGVTMTDLIPVSTKPRWAYIWHCPMISPLLDNRTK